MAVQVENLVATLNLPDSREEILVTPSKLSQEDSIRAGFSAEVRTWEKAKTYFDATPGTRAENIIKRLSEHRKAMYYAKAQKKYDGSKVKLEIMDITSGYNPTEANIARHSALVDFLNTIWIEHITQNLGNRAQDRYELTRVKQGGRPLTRTVTRARKEKEKETKDVAFPLTLRMLSIGYLEVGSKEVVHYREDTAHFEPWHIVASMTTESKILSELSIEQILGGKVRSTFFTPTCVVTSDLKTPSIEVLQMSPGRDPRPDLALVYRNEAYAHLKLAPVFSVAEVKRVKTGAGKKETPKAPSFQAQIQSAIYPTLIMLSLFHTSAELNEEFQTDDELPEHYFIYGIYLDEAQIKIYAHFPFYSTQESGWRFAQVEMADLTLPSYGTVTEEPSENAREYFNHREQENAILRWQLIQALLTTRAHTSELVRLFKENDEPKWIKLCELYEQTNQGNSATQSGHAQTLAERLAKMHLSP